MEIYESLIEFFGIEAITETATFVDLVNYGISLFVAVFIVCFIFRSLFLIVAIPDSKIW